MPLFRRLPPRRYAFIALAATVLVAGFGVHARLFAQQASYAPGVEGQIWQQLPVMGRGIDSVERPITTDPTVSDPNPLGGVANLWPCSTVAGGYPDLCYSSGTIGVGTGLSPTVVQLFGGRFAPETLMAVAFRIGGMQGIMVLAAAATGLMRITDPIPPHRPLRPAPSGSC